MMTHQTMKMIRTSDLVPYHPASIATSNVATMPVATTHARCESTGKKAYSARQGRAVGSQDRQGHDCIAGARSKSKRDAGSGWLARRQNTPPDRHESAGGPKIQTKVTKATYPTMLDATSLRTAGRRSLIIACRSPGSPKGGWCTGRGGQWCVRAGEVKNGTHTAGSRREFHILLDRGKNRSQPTTHSAHTQTAMPEQPRRFHKQGPGTPHKTSTKATARASDNQRVVGRKPIVNADANDGNRYDACHGGQPDVHVCMQCRVINAVG